MVRAVNRKGETFEEGEDVMMVDFPVLYPQMTGQLLTITGINEYDGCESGFQIQAMHKETQKPFKSKLDTNWFKKIKS
jgi:hypothetical protein